jgi:hypothetical protein
VECPAVPGSRVVRASLTEARNAARESIYRRCMELADARKPPPDQYSVEGPETAKDGIEGDLAMLSVNIEPLFARRRGSGSARQDGK